MRRSRFSSIFKQNRISAIVTALFTIIFFSVAIYALSPEGQKMYEGAANQGESSLSSTEETEMQAFSPRKMQETSETLPRVESSAETTLPPETTLMATTVAPSTTSPAKTPFVATEATTEAPPVTEAPTAPPPPSTEAPTAPPPPPTQPPTSNLTSQPEMAQAVLDYVNQERANAGVGGLSWDDTLTGSAAIRAQEIQISWSHTRPDGSPWYTAGAQKQMGENLAYGQSSASQVVSEWMASSGHRENILDGRYSQMGVACYYDSSTGTYYWAQHFA